MSGIKPRGSKRPAASSSTEDSSGTLHISASEPRAPKRQHVVDRVDESKQQQQQQRPPPRGRRRRGRGRAKKNDAPAVPRRSPWLPPAKTFPHGNYDSFFWYGRQKDVWADCRLKVLREEFFRGRDCLDVGCNSGVLDIGIACRFGPRKLLGVDIDQVVVQRALSLVKRKARELEQGASAPLGALQFKVLDFLSVDPDAGVAAKDMFDTVMCLCVTKWVHINGGDAALRRLLRLLAVHTRPGGYLILQPQPKSSYRARNFRMCNQQHEAVTLDSSKGFEALLNGLGFKLTHKMRPDAYEGVGGAKHKLFVYKKRINLGR